MVEQLNTSPEKPDKKNNTLLKVILGIVVGGFLLLCGLAVLGGAYYVIGRQATGPITGPRFEITLEPDYSQVSTVDHADLQAAAEILTARARSLGYPNVSFTVTENNQIIGQAPASADVEALLTGIKDVGLLEFVDLGPTPLEAGMKLRTDFDYPYFPAVDGKIWHTIMSNAGFKSASLTKDVLRKNAISFTLTSEGKKIFADFTTQNVGHYLAIVLDKVVVSAPVINAPILEGNGIIQGAFTEEEAKALVAYLNTKGPLPFPLIVKDVVKSGK